jgi:hypothetical protein
LSLSCGEEDTSIKADFLPLLHTADINYSSPVYSADSTLALNEDLPASTNLVYSYSMIPTGLTLHQTGANVSEIKSAVLSFRMSIEPHGFYGTGLVTLYISDLADVYNNSKAVVLSAKKVLPATFELSSSHALLPYILQEEQFYIGYRVVLEPQLLSSHQVSASGWIETLSAELTGSGRIP